MTQILKQNLAQVFYFGTSGDIVFDNVARGTMLTKSRNVSDFSVNRTVDLDGSRIKTITFFRCLLSIQRFRNTKIRTGFSSIRHRIALTCNLPLSRDAGTISPLDVTDLRKSWRILSGEQVSWPRFESDI